MTQYNFLKVKLSNSQLNKLKSGIKHGTEVTENFIKHCWQFLIMRIIFHINCYSLTHKFQSFISFLEVILQLI